MLNNRHFIAYSITTFFYLLFAGIIVYLPTATKIATESSQEKVIQLSVTEFMTEVLPSVEEVIEEIVEEKVEKEEPKPEVEVKVEELQVEKPVVIPVVVKKVLPKVTKTKPVKKPKKKKTKKKSTKKKQVKRKTSSVQRKVNPAKVNLFYKKIRVKMNRHKFYPKIAKRRGMQGSVKVSFTILPSGKVSRITLVGPKVFQKSARKAVESVFPLNVKNVPVSLPTRVNVTLHYQIR
ncbi:MAG: TonB family protein [Sulfurovum sp.]|nr:TonB family protein [Sulfurovum sp.]